MEILHEGGCLCGKPATLPADILSHVGSVIAVTASFVLEAHLLFWRTSSRKILG